MAISINGTSGISGVDGSAATPALQGTDTNTGISFGTDIVDINAGATTTIRTSPSSTQFRGIGGEGAELQLSDNDGTTFGSFIDVDGSGNLRVRTGGTNRDLYLGQVSGTGGITAFFTEGTERMRITSGGTIRAISTGTGATFSTTLATSDSSNSAIEVKGGGTAGVPDSGTRTFQVNPSGNVKNANNSYGSLSDIKLKENIVDANSQWNDLKALQVRNYNFKEGQTHTQIGLVAQEVELISPGLVTESPDIDKDGNDLGTVTKSVIYSVLYMKAVKALQEAMERIETLETKVAALEGGAS